MSQTTVHLIDDDDAVRDALSVLLGLHGLTVECHASAEAFLARPRPTQGCVVSDVEMPGISGLTLLQRLSGEPNGLAVILMTARPEPRIAAEAARWGAKGLLRKPFPPGELLRLVRAATGGG